MSDTLARIMTNILQFASASGTVLPNTGGVFPAGAPITLPRIGETLHIAGADNRKVLDIRYNYVVSNGAILQLEIQVLVP